MASKSTIIFSLLVILSVSFSVTAGDSGSSTLLPCVQKILPCQPYLKSAASPPATCCIPLRDVVANDQKCVCAVFNNADLLKTFNITQDDALKLAKACQANADVSICKTLHAGAPSSSPPASAPAKGPSKPEKSTAHGIRALGGFMELLVLASVILFAAN